MKSELRFIDLFCGIGGFRLAAEGAAKTLNRVAKCKFSSDSDLPCRETYQKNFGERPAGDITKIDSTDIPDHDLLLGGFPCQPFSIIGNKLGFDDVRGTLFFDIARILKAKKPSLFVLENVKLLVGHDGGKTLQTILKLLRDIGYHVEYRVLNALDFGLPQKRERIWIVGSLKPFNMQWPLGGIPMTPLKKVLETNVDPKHFASDHIRNRRHAVLTPGIEPTIWHENKAGNISAYPYSCALRAGASYNYLLVDGIRRLTPREMLRLQGFPDSFKIVSSDSQTRRQAGNSLPVTVAQQVITALLLSVENGMKATSIPWTEKGKIDHVLCEPEAKFG